VFEVICTASSSQPGVAVVSHPDWNFTKRLAEGESAIIYQGELNMIPSIVIQSSQQLSRVFLNNTCLLFIT